MEDPVFGLWTYLAKVVTTFYIQLALDVFACSIATCVSPECLFYIILCCLTCLFYTLQHPVLRLTWTCLFYGILCCVRSTAACSVPGSFCFSEASAALSLSVFQQPLLSPGLSVIKPPVLTQNCLFNSNPYCPGRCLAYKQLELHLLDVSVYESLCCAEPGHICLREPVLC
jgi:hypothetical protein